MINVFLTQYDGAILGPIAKLLGFILQGIYSFFDKIGIDNAGLSIVLFTFIVNGLMIPITIKQQKFSKMNAVLTPELQAIRDKYKGKTDQESTRLMQIEQQSVYNKYGVSPTAGCLPMLITLPIFFALYRVIYNIPAYVPQIKEIYENIINTAVSSGISMETFTHNLAAFVNKSNITDVTINSSLITTQSNINKIVEEFGNISGSGALSAAANNYIVDILSQFRFANWEELKSMDMLKSYPAIVDSINVSYDKLRGVYSFLGMNIMEAPKWNSLTISVPVLAVVTQFINNKVMMSTSKEDKEKKKKQAPQDPTTQSMNTMNNIMPFMSGIFCFMFPIGVGLYWVAGNVFRTIQGIFINMYFNKIGIDGLVEKNIEKRNKKLEKKGIDPNSTKMQQVAKTRTSSLNTNSNTKANASKNYKNNSGSGKGDFYINKNIKSGSIADYANMMNRNYDNSNASDDTDSSESDDK